MRLVEKVLTGAPYSVRVGGKSRSATYNIIYTGLLMTTKDKIPDSFCAAIATHTYISPQCERRMCCASREVSQFSGGTQYIDIAKGANTKFSPVPLAEWWNSEYLRNVRVQMKRGEYPNQCQVCNDRILSESPYKNYFNNFLFKDKLEEIFDSIDENGYVEALPVSFDYRFSNLCNFKCRMCGEALSSSWESEKKKHNLWTPKNQPFMVPEVKTKMQAFQQTVVEPEFRDAVTRGILEECYWVGGEPLMYDIHWWALQEMVDNGSAKNCYLRYNSNLSRTNFNGKDLFDYLPLFKDWMMCASIDGAGEIGEYIRTGLNWDLWLSNFKRGLSLPNGKDRMIIDLTITGPGMFSLKELFDLSIELDVRIETKIMFAFHPDLMFTAMSWPREILNGVIDDLLAYMKPLATHKQMSLINTLESMKRRQTHEEAFPESFKEAAKRGKDWLLKLEELRLTSSSLKDVYSKNKALSNWWENI